MKADEKQARQAVYLRSKGVCERCGKAPSNQWHHRINRSQGGPWTAANGMHLCTRCHAYITEHPKVSYQMGWSIRGRKDPTTTPVYLARHGWVLLQADGTFEHCAPPEEDAA